MTWLEVALRLVLAVAIGCVIGIEREHKSRPAGMRTHVLVCVGAAMIAIIECLNIAETLNMNQLYSDSGIALSVGRLSAQVVSGIGFLGAGTILVSQKKIAGLTTAASLWCTACLGLAAGMGHYVLAVAGCLIVIITLTLMQRVVRVNTVKNLEVQFVRRNETIPFINAYFEKMGVTVIDVDFHIESKEKGKGKEKVYTNLYTLDMPRKIAYKDIVNDLSEYANIEVIRTISPN
ncbi:MAG: MgtC/SapB family protein [Clostridia bacterium]|nr:MgtC/SapB family protein [Clostridia bacterium]